MKVQLDKTIPLSNPPDDAWKFLRNVESVAACMPGAELTEQVSETHYKGVVKVKVGPAVMSFKGELAIEEVNADTRSIRLTGKGTDSTGTSGASMNLDARIEAVDGGSSALVGSSEVSMSGKAAAFGGRMMNSVADQILKQFGEHFAAGVAALDQGTADAAAGGEIASGVAAPKGQELNALALMWAVIRDWFRSLFLKKSA